MGLDRVPNQRTEALSPHLCAFADNELKRQELSVCGADLFACNKHKFN